MKMKQAGMIGRARKSYVASAERLHRQRQMTEQEFRLQADQALEDLQHALLPLADERRLRDRAAERRAAVVFEEPEPAKFVVSPNAPVRQIWLSALSRSYKLRGRRPLRVCAGRRDPLVSRRDAFARQHLASS